MSDDMLCEVCGRSGRRRKMKHCPDGWYYAETLVEGPGGKQAVYVLAACSETCRNTFWRPGPGDLRTGLYDEEGKSLLRSLGLEESIQKVARETQDRARADEDVKDSTVLIRVQTPFEKGLTEVACTADQATAVEMLVLWLGALDGPGERTRGEPNRVRWINAMRTFLHAAKMFVDVDATRGF